MRLAEKVVLVTGSARGIGEAIARAAAAEGAAVVVHSATSHEAGEAVASSLPTGAYLAADVSDEAQAADLVSRAHSVWGRLDVVVNNAGTNSKVPAKSLDDVTTDEFNRVLGVNLLGPWFVARAAAPLLRASGGGSIINLSSRAGIQAQATTLSIPYAVSKAALIHLTKILARAMAPEIRVNCLVPGFVRTRLTSGINADRLIEGIPLRQATPAEDVADMCIVLATNRHTTGQMVGVEGGLMLVGWPP